MSGSHWIVEGKVDERWPINTRGNVGEVMPEVVTPLQNELVVAATDGGFRDALARVGLLQPGDIASEEPVLLNVLGGYAYLNLSLLRLLGVRTPGSSPEAIDFTFVGEGNPPPYQPMPGDKNLQATLRLVRSALIALRQRDLPTVVADNTTAAADVERARPALDSSDADLVAFLRSTPAAFRPVFANHIYASAMSAIPAGVLSDAAVAAGDPASVATLIGAVGDVRSAEYSRDLAQVATYVRSSVALTQHFDEGADGLLERLRSDPQAGAFVGAFDHFVAQHGHRGPNDWDIAGRTWANTPSLTLAAIERLRVDLPSSSTNSADSAASARAETIARIRRGVKPFQRKPFDLALTSIGSWTRAREGTRDRAVRFLQPAKQVFRELARRCGERGGIGDPAALTLLTLDELSQYLGGHDMAPIIATRLDLYRRFVDATPRFFITSPATIPSLEELETERPAAATKAIPGEVLTGTAGSGGTAVGRARIVLDPGECADLEPGEILVCPITDPGWTPLFLPAAAVVVETGALMSHAVIVSRELGLPCVVAVPNATTRLTNGQRIEVNGTNGTVTVLP
jgi:rifampicin phosphotransferase